MNTVELTARAKPFSTAPMGNFKFRVNVAEKEVQVYDDVAKHFTSCHSMSKATQRRIIRLAY